MDRVEQLFKLAEQIQDRYRHTEDFKREYMSLKESLVLAAQIMGNTPTDCFPSVWTLKDLQIAVMRLSDRSYQVFPGRGLGYGDGSEGFALTYDGLRGYLLRGVTAEEILDYVKANP